MIIHLLRFLLIALIIVFFVKDTSYRFQNEYRIVIDGKTQPLKSNRKNGYLLRTKPLTSAHIFESSVLLNTAKIIIEDD